MRAGALVWGIAALLWVMLKLFTFEFLLRDDPTVGIALRAAPSMVSHRVVEHSPNPRLILIQDENDFIGGPPYRWVVRWGWIILVAGLPLMIVRMRLRSRSRGR
jgi:hypothetical protein